MIAESLIKFASKDRLIIQPRYKLKAAKAASRWLILWQMAINELVKIVVVTRDYFV